MNIKARINARKVVFSYFFQKYFTQHLLPKDIVFDEIVKTEIFVHWTSLNEAQLTELKDQLNNYYDNDTWEDNVEFIINNFFEKEKEIGIDFDYVKQMAPQYPVYKDIVEQRVDKYRETFEYKEMDLVDRVIFLLGYIENKLELSPRAVVLNEMIELAKKYGDENSYKLINGIGHKLLNE